MIILTPTGYDEVAFKISTFLHTGEKTEYDIELEMLSLFSISSEMVKDILNQMKRLRLIIFSEDNFWSLTPELLVLIETNDNRLFTLISSFQFGGDIPFITPEEEPKVIEEIDQDDLEIFRIEIEKKISDYKAFLRSRLKEFLLKMNAYRLEEVVIELLVKSGEGKLGFTTLKSNDGGIDGYIFESYLKQGAMAVQTKRYAENLLVKKNEIHEFMSVCREKGVKNGYFVTTSSFSDTAIGVARLELCLVDGDQLVDLIIKTKLGLKKISGTLYSIDDDYFFRPPMPSGKVFQVLQ